MMKKFLIAVTTMMLSVALLMPMQSYAMEIDTTSEQIGELSGVEPFRYTHDPRRNPKAMEDIIYDPSCVYGFRPREDSERLAVYADEDWTDPVKVEGWKQDRIEYLKDFDILHKLWSQLEAEGKSIEEIARAVSAKRNELRLASYANDPEGLAKAKQSNLDKYGDENGPTIESLYEKYGTWEKVLLKSFSSNAGMDACLGLYDVQYDNNNRIEPIEELSFITYTVNRGDYLSMIAYEWYGDKTLWKKIYNANKKLIRDPNLIYEGQELIVPFD